MNFMNILVFMVISVFAIVSTSYPSHGYDHGSVDAAVKSSHSVSTYPVQSSQMVAKNPVVDINSGPLPLTIRFNTHSSQINAQQKHFGSQGQVQKASAVDQPDLLIQNIKKPVIQEVRETIAPFRSRTQEVRPVQEKIETIIAQGGGGSGKGKYSAGSEHY
ncbi:hypothetical protein BLOT_012498 [Blomia tropicalis]|nr:hypothetical protein BLOT_012498 [Blomia tropicalis]